MKEYYTNVRFEKINKIKKRKLLKINVNLISKTFSKILLSFLLMIIFYNNWKTREFSSNKNNYIHIAVNFDNKYIYPFIVYLTSLLINRAKSTFYIIHVLTGNNIINGTFDKINKTLEAFGKNASNVSYYNLGDQFKGATSGQYISTAAYYRISLPSLLPDVDKIIYTDTDIINFKDLSEMYDIELKNTTYFCGTLDFVGHLGELRKLGVYTDKYMNTGIMLMNLKAMRNSLVENDIRNFVSHHFLNHHEQTAINAVCYNNIQILSYKYAGFAFESYEKLLNFNNNQTEKFKYNESELNQSFYDPTLLHFPGYTKPWERKCLNKRRIYWWYYAKKSVYYQEILDHYGFKSEEIEDLLKNKTQA